MSHVKGFLEKLPKHKLVMDSHSYRLAHPVYSMVDIEKVEQTHVIPQTFRDRFAYRFMRGVRTSFDYVSGYNEQKMTPKQWLTRIIFLETIAGIPGFVSGMHRHMRSLRKLKSDHGWIHYLLEESENERMHLFLFLKLQQPSALVKLFILLGQGVFFNLYFIFYMFFPKYCHRFVGYLEEEAVHTYTVLLKQLDEGVIPDWQNMPASEFAKDYYKLASDAKLRDVILSVRADEAVHREFHHHFADIDKDADIEQEEITIEQVTGENKKAA